MDDGSWDFGDWGIRKLINQCKKQLVWKQINDVGFVNTFDYGGDVVHIAKLIKQTYMEAKPGKLPIQFAYTDLDPDGENHEPAVEQFEALLKMVCGNNDVLYQYVLRWLAHIIQKPYDLPGVMLILSGGKGVGKDTIFDFLFAYVFGKKSSQNYSSNKQFFEKHDTGRQGKLLVKLEEADRKYCLDNASDLKAMVTSPDATFNPKCEKAVSIPNYCRFVFTTNGGNPVDFGDGERRFIILPCSAEKKGDLAYWTTVRETLFNEQAGLAVAKFLEAVDLTGFNVRQLPENEYQDAVVDTEIKAEQRYIEHWDGQKILASEMYRAYRSFCVENSMLHAENVLSFSKRLLPFKRDNIIDNKRTNKGVVYWKVGVQQNPDE
jgi:phage/plasmid-associated DNA primase